MGLPDTSPVPKKDPMGMDYIATEAAKSLKDANEDTQAAMRRLAESSLARLRNWDVSDEQLRTLAQSGQAVSPSAFAVFALAGSCL